MLMLLGLVAAWSWLFLVSKWGPAKRIDILTFKAGVTSRVMRTLLRFPESTMHEHDAAGMSAIYATPEYYAMTEQNQDAAKFQPDKFAVFYLFEDIHMGELPEAPPTATLRLDDGEQLTPIDTTVLRGSYHHRVSVIRFPNTDTQGQTLLACNKLPWGFSKLGRRLFVPLCCLLRALQLCSPQPDHSLDLRGKNFTSRD